MQLLIYNYFNAIFFIAALFCITYYFNSLFCYFFQANQRKLQIPVAELRYDDGVQAVIPCAMTWTQRDRNLHSMQSCISNVQVSMSARTGGGGGVLTC